jgi:hypothetical protein
MRDNAIRDSLIRFCALLGLHTVKRTRHRDLDTLIHGMQPIDSGVELIRIGPDGDGGYLVPDDLSGIEYCFSPGVSTESGFEADLAARGMAVHLADLSVDGPAELHENFTFTKKHVGCLSNAQFMTLDEWKEARIGAYGGDLLLQMDIEGAEFETLMALSSELQAQFRIMVIELHYLHQLLNKPWFILVSRVINKLLETHSVVHIHPNNCCGSIASRGLTLPRIVEVTFYRNDRVQRHGRYRHDFPHPLDRDNVAKAALPLPGCWIGD